MLSPPRSPARSGRAHPTFRRRGSLAAMLGSALTALAVALVPVLTPGSAQAAPLAGGGDLGPNVIVFDPSTSSSRPQVSSKKRSSHTTLESTRASSLELSAIAPGRGRAGPRRI